MLLDRNFCLAREFVKVCRWGIETKRGARVGHLFKFYLGCHSALDAESEFPLLQLLKSSLVLRDNVLLRGELGAFGVYHSFGSAAEELFV